MTSAPRLHLPPKLFPNTAFRNQVPTVQATFSTVSLDNRPQLRPPPEILQLPQEEEEMKEELPAETAEAKPSRSRRRRQGGNKEKAEKAPEKQPAEPAQKQE